MMEKQKKIGQVALLSTQIEIGKIMGEFGNVQELMALRSNLLTNGYQAPIPAKLLNQRQKRKRARQKHK